MPFVGSGPVKKDQSLLEGQIAGDEAVRAKKRYVREEIVALIHILEFIYVLSTHQSAQRNRGQEVNEKSICREAHRGRKE